MSSGSFQDREPNGRERLNRNLRAMLGGKGLTDGWNTDGQGPKSTEDPSVKGVPTAGQAAERVREESRRTQADEIALDALRKSQMGRN